MDQQRASSDELVGPTSKISKGKAFRRLIKKVVGVGQKQAEAKTGPTDSAEADQPESTIGRNESETVYQVDNEAVTSTVLPEARTPRMDPSIRGSLEHPHPHSPEPHTSLETESEQLNDTKDDNQPSSASGDDTPSLWEEAYDRVRSANPGDLDHFERILSMYWNEAVVPHSSVDEPLGNKLIEGNRIDQQDIMMILETWLNGSEETKNGPDDGSIAPSVKEALRGVALKDPQAAVAWVAACFSTYVCASPFLRVVLQLACAYHLPDSSRLF